MFVTNLHFEQIINWFSGSTFQYLMMFLPSYDTKDRFIDDYIIRNQHSIDSLTGKDIAYITFEESTTSSNPIFVSIVKRNVYKEQIRCNLTVAEEACAYFGFLKYKLPAIILIPREIHKYKLYSVSSEHKLDSFFSPIGIISSYLSDKLHLECDLRRYSCVDNDLESVYRRNEEIESRIVSLNEKSTLLQDDPQLPQRINKNYCKIFNLFKQNEIKQNIFDNCFVPLTNYNDVRTRLSKLYSSEEYLFDLQELVVDLAKVPFFDGFHSQYGDVIKQMKRLFSQIPGEISKCESSLLSVRDRIISLKVDKEVAEKKIENLQQEMIAMQNLYAQKLQRATLMDNALEYLLSFRSSESSLIDLLDFVQEKNEKVNFVLERLNKLVEEENFDVFISCKSQDYESATDVYFFLKEQGYTPFLADKTLREIGTDNYGYLIRRIIGQCKYMIVYASDIEYISTPYVGAEWNQYLDELSAGHIDGKLFSIVPQKTNAGKLPAGLRTKQFFFVDTYKESLLSYMLTDTVKISSVYDGKTEYCGKVKPEK